MERLNRRLGRDALFYAGSGIRRDWRAFAKMKSRHFTTSWGQILEVDA